MLNYQRVCIITYGIWYVIINYIMDLKDYVYNIINEVLSYDIWYMKNIWY